MTPRELVYATLEMRNTNGRIPRQLWLLPWAETRYPQMLAEIRRDFPDDIVGAPTTYPALPETSGDPYAVGESVDAWGCRFHNIQAGVIGEVKTPLVTTEDWSDTGSVHIPVEYETFSADEVNRFCATTDKFVLCGACPRPFEQLQFIRGTENLYIDLMDPPPAMLAFMRKMHEHYCRLLTAWAKTDVDALQFMDDWGAQQALLISPSLWVQYFKPLYRDYINIAKAHGKKIFMHSDGYTLDIIPHLIELGLDAMNAQLFCMGVEKLAPFKGKITFWGEICRQQLLPHGSIQDIDNAVRLVYDTLWDNGGCIAQYEFGPGANPDNAYRVFAAWQEISGNRN